MAESVPDSELATYLQEQGLEDVSYWLPLFEEIGVKNKTALSCIEQNVVAYNKLAEKARKDNLVEAQALRHIFKIVLEKQEQKRSKDAEAAQQIHRKLDEARSELSDQHGQRVDKLDSKAAECLQITFGPSNNFSGEVIAKHEGVLEAGGKHQERNLLEDKLVLRRASKGRALQGVLLTKHLKDQLEDRSRLLEVPKDVMLCNVAVSQEEYVHFMSKHEEEEYTKRLEILGWGLTVSASVPVYGSVAIGGGISYNNRNESEEMYSKSQSEVYVSTVGYVTVHTKSYTFENKQFLLSEDAKRDLQDILQICQQQGSSSGNVQTSCEKFFNKYGSHVNEGPVVFGGEFRYVCFSTGVSTANIDTVKQQQIDSISGKMGITACGIGASMGAHRDKVRGSTDGKRSMDSETSTNLHKSIFGGPTSVSDVTKWKEGIVVDNNMWEVIDRGRKLKAVWDIVRMNHKEELGEIVHVLRKAWEEMSGLKADTYEQDILKFDSQAVLKEVSQWNAQNLSQRQVVDNLSYLLSVREDVFKSTANRAIWIKEYLSQRPLQEFFKFTIVGLGTLKLASASYIRIVKSLVHQLIEKEDLSMITSRNFPDIEQVSQWLCSDQEHSGAADLSMNCFDFESFDQYLEEKIMNENMALLTSENPTKRQAFNASLAQDVSIQLNYLRSNYQNTYEDILITTLVNPFKAEKHDNLIALKPLSIDDLKILLNQLSERKREFDVYASEQNPQKQQAFLFKLAMDVCDKSEEVQHLQHVEKMLDDVDSFLKEKLHLYIRHPGRIDFKEVLQSCMTSTHVAPVQQSSFSAPDDHSLLKVLETKACEYDIKETIHSDVFGSNDVAHKLFERLGLCDYYCNKLQLQKALCISPKVLRQSLNEHIQGANAPIDLEKLPFLILHKIMAYDCSCRSDLTLQIDNTEMDSDSESEGETSGESGNESADEKPSKGAVADTNRVNPVDSLLALLLCSDDFLRQDLFSRLAKCQLAVPFLLPDPFTKKFILPLWAMRSIVMQWKCVKPEPKEYELPLIKFGMPIVSFVRFGRYQRDGASKSKMLNDVISNSQHNPFFHRDCPGGQIDLQIGKGLVDICWYLPSGKHTDMFQLPIAFLNLHGDAQLSEHIDQLRFLSHISSMCFALITEKELSLNAETIEILNRFSSSPGGLTVLKDVDKRPKPLKQVLKAYVIKLSDMNAESRKLAIQKRIKKRLTPEQQFETICGACVKDITKESNIRIDEESEPCSHGLQLANSVMQIVNVFCDEQSKLKGVMLPLQGKLMWQAWAEKDKEASRQIHRGNKKVEEYSSFIRCSKKEIRANQMKHVKCLTPMMESFIMSLLKVSGPSNRAVRNYFLQYLKMSLNDFSKEKVSVLQHQYCAVAKMLAEVQYKKKSSDGKKVEDIDKEADASICRYKEEMDTLQNDIVSASFGLEHIFRELGQLYEAAQDQESSKFGSKLAYLPRVVAELVIEGYPLELMDGNVAHVPSVWVSAVIEQIASMLKDPKVYVLSVLGLQTTGKSTMLNTTFGLQFKVSNGRCTRGAFMQLLPLDKELIERTNCHYMLVVDTEGLRAPELKIDSLQTQKHDNELATFVIGLANITLININGEVPGNMDDILQTSVHAFLRMNQVKFHPSCYFVHQNAGASIKSEPGRHNFTLKLNKFTVEAATEENCKERYETFSDVIAFDDQKDVHHFPALWKGDPPMAPINQGYSDSAQKLKYHLTEVLVEGTCHRGSLLYRRSAGDLNLSLFQQKFESLWKALLQEKFVFSFRNTLEITAYKSLETKYGLLESDFRYKMREWRDRVKNLIESVKPTDSENIPGVVNTQCDGLHVFVKHLYDDFSGELEAFFTGSKQNDILAQWRAKFETDLRVLSQKLKEDAMSHCKRIGSSKEAISEIDRKNMDYMDIARRKARELIASLKQKRRQLNENLEKRALKKSQLKELLKFNLFTPDAVESYRLQTVLTDDQARKVTEVLHECGTLNEEYLKKILYMLPLERVKKILQKARENEAQLKVHFNSLWLKLLTDIQFVPLRRIDIKHAVQSKLIDFVKTYTYEGKLIEKIQQNRPTSDATLMLEVKEGVHYKKNEGMNVTVQFGMWIYDKYRNLHDIDDPTNINAQVLTNIVFEKVRDYLQRICTTDGSDDFHEDYTTELLNLLNKIITEESAKFAKEFYFEPDYRLDVYLAACQYAVGEFEKMAEAFTLKHNPKEWLKAKMKEPLFITYKNQYYEIEAEEAIANTLCVHMKTPIQKRVENSIGRIMAKQMQFLEPHFKSKMALKLKILSDLHDRDSFEDYMLHVTNVKESFKKWLRTYSEQYCNGLSGCNESRLQITAKNEVTSLVKMVKEKVNKINETNTRKWMTIFCEDVTLRQEFGFNFEADDVVIDHCEIKELNLESFRSLLMSGLQHLNDELRTLFSGIVCESQHVKEKPYKLLHRLAGCTAQCPFCNEQCDWMDHDVKTKKHRVAVHRPGCLTGRMDVNTFVMVTDICPAAVAGERCFKTRHTNDEFHPYRRYQEIYPDWSIEPDPTCEDSLYWMLFVSKYNEGIAQKFGPEVKPASVPQQWAGIEWDEAKEKLRQQYNL
jgi:hypothetical protein